jgi:hypothetical protein
MPDFTSIAAYINFFLANVVSNREAKVGALAVCNQNDKFVVLYIQMVMD